MTTKSTKNLTKTLAILLVIVIVSFSGVLVYLYSQVSFRDSQLVAVHTELDQQYSSNAQLGSQVNSLNDQISSLNATVANLQGLKEPRLVTALGITEIQGTGVYNQNDLTTFNHLYISGTVTNRGLSTAYNAGLHVLAYDAGGGKILDITIPLSSGTYGSGQPVTTVLSTLESLQEASFVSNYGISIVHPGLAHTWNIIPVCTSAP